MRRCLTTTIVLTALCAVCLAVFIGRQSGDGMPAEEAYRNSASCVVAPQHQHHQEATLTDASQIYRICSSRPQRILPSQGSKTERTPTPLAHFAIRQHHTNPLCSYHDSRCRRETAPFSLSASRDYYVIALRHIIC